MAEPLADIPDLIERLGRELTDTETIRAGALLKDASAAVRRAAGGQLISAGTSTIRMAPNCGRLHLPQIPVTAVTSVENSASQAVTFVWYDGWNEVVVDSSLLINAWEIEPFRYATPMIPMTVTYGHGYAVAPDDIKAIVCSATARALGVDPVGAGVVQEQLGSYSYSVGSAAAQGGVGLLDSEMAVAQSYRRPRPAISML